MSARKLQLNITTPFGPEALYIERMVAEERLSGLFRFDVTLISPDPALDFEKIVGEPVTISLDNVGGDTRYFHGIVARFSQAGVRDEYHYYQAEVVPSLWLLTLSSDNRIFQEMTTEAIVKEILTEHGVTDVRIALNGTYSPREYCVQYGETAFAFVSRLMEEEGIFYFFEHADGKHTLVLGDDASAHAATSPHRVPLAPAHAEREIMNTVVECGYQQQLVPGGAAVIDYNFETPTNRLLSTAEGATATGRFKTMGHPGGFANLSGGDRIAKLRAEAHELPAATLSGSSYTRGFCAGYEFALEDHPRAQLNTGYVLSSVTHTIDQDRYQNAFEAFPLAIPFRPPLRTPKPRIPGAQTAKVVGPSGEKIHTDRYGRVKVQFHWDTYGKSDEKSSCWIRVLQGWAGKTYGSFFLPRIDQEVLVTFIDGDIDRPIVTGCVYNAVQAVPYALPDHQTRSLIKTQSTPDGDIHNELRFEDKSDNQEIWLQAAKDFNADVVNDRTWMVHHDSIETVTNDRTATISEGNEKLVVSKGNRTVEVGEGDDIHTIKKGNRTLEVQTGNDTYTVEGDRTIAITGDETRSSNKLDWSTRGNFTLKVTGDIVIDATGSITLKAGKDLTLQSTNNLTSKGLNITNKAELGLTNEAGAKLENKAGATLNNKSDGMQSVEAQGVLNVKSAAVLNVQGSLVKIN